MWEIHLNHLFSDRQSEPLLRPDAKDRASSIFHQIETHRSDSITNDKENNLFSSNVIGLHGTSSASSFIQMIWFKLIQLFLVVILKFKTMV